MSGEYSEKVYKFLQKQKGKWMEKWRKHLCLWNFKVREAGMGKIHNVLEIMIYAHVYETH